MHLEVTTKPLPHRTDQRLVRVAAPTDLPGSSVVIELRDDGLDEDENDNDGVLSGSFRVPAATVTGTYPLRVWTEDSNGSQYPPGGILEVQHSPPTAVTDEEDSDLPYRWELSQSFPNPFNSDTVIHFAVDEPGTIDLEIHNVAGHRLATVVDGERPAGRYGVHWDGTDDDGLSLASGVYLYRLHAGGRQLLRKLLLVR